MNPNHNHDLCTTMGELRREIAIATAGSVPREFSAFEHYIQKRLNGEKPGNDLLDPLPIFVAGDICELAGMVSLHGKKVETSKKTDQDWWLAGAAGFDRLKAGLPGLHRFLDGLHVQADHERAYYGGTQLYGKFYQTLANSRDNPAYNSVKNEIRSYAYSSLPLTDTTSIFGKFEKPRYLSFASFERKFGITAFLLKKVLVATGALCTLPGSNVDAIDAESAELVASTIRDLVRAKQGATLIGISYQVFNTLIEDGIVVPAIPQDDDARISAWYSKSELIRFRERLLPKGNPKNTDGLIAIQDVIRSTACSYGEILTLLSRNELKRIGIDRSKFGIMSLMLDRDEIKGKVLLPHHGCLTAADLSNRWKTSTKAIYALFNNDHIETRIERNPETRSPQKVVAVEAVEAFENRYISLAECCERSGLTSPKASNRLKASGLTRVFPKEQMKDAFYLRDGAEAALSIGTAQNPVALALAVEE
ncbi:hypothetical protein AOX55_00001813 [Sinorhizobium fredii CCBAU 25509]|nr:hypothetical protein AOX55_00001813 [Sinorhizobium fredii CCBAU 25509]